MRTDNWGYFYKAHERSNESYWRKYDIIPHIWITAIVTAVLWLLVTVLDIYKYALVVWKLAIPTFFLSLVTILLNLFGSIFIAFKINRFDSDNSGFWKFCDCGEFKDRFYMSVRMLFLATVVALALAVIHFIIEIVFWVKKPK
eukprot:TRINITY_DN10055_c0_g1_i14.p1 TRINITY_DN10055_c0_g1~~TRINITY_DN10055_c0_g1_i14.p1  ORF type:complete len:143 (+),score=24.21 TRINITY_DN10055_c0_g1_i14:619-1047(+)